MSSFIQPIAQVISAGRLPIAQSLPHQFTFLLIDPLSPWSLWVPLLLLGLIILAAVYFVRVTPR